MRPPGLTESGSHGEVTLPVQAVPLIPWCGPIPFFYLVLSKDNNFGFLSSQRLFSYEIIILTNNIIIQELMSYFYSQKHRVQSQYSRQWRDRDVHLHITETDHIIRISEKDGKGFKEFPINKVKFEETQKRQVVMKLGSQRKYKLEGSNTGKLRAAINQYNIIQNFEKERPQSTAMIPKTINYGTLFNLNLTSEQNDQQAQETEQSVVYPRQRSYLLEDEWEINKQRGGLTLISEEKKKNQSKILKYVVKKIISTGSFMGISFPVFAMKPQTILQTYGKSIGAAPLLFEKCPSDPVERLKRYVAFVFSFSRIFSDMDKPFNPVIGETFQGMIAGGLYAAEQTSHHPPQSSFIYEGKGYKIYSTLELIAKIGVNDADGLFDGDIHVQFDDGGHLFGRALCGTMSGFLLGQNKFRPQGSCYAYDPINKIVCTFKRSTKDIFTGHIGTLKPKYQLRFEKQIQKKSRFGKDFSACEQKQFETILSKIQAKWSKNVTCNMKTYINFNFPEHLPYALTKNGVTDILKSDSSFRKDTALRAQKRMEQAQQEKERIEELERTFRKLREKYGLK